MLTLEAQITQEQARVIARMTGAQSKLLAALIATCAVIAVVAVGSVAAMRRWLLRPSTALRSAAESVAAGRYETHIPVAGPTELANLGRAAEHMRTRLVDALGAAQRAEDRFRRLFESAPDATLTVAADGTIAMVNAKAERMLGYTRDELAGQPVEIIVPDTLRKVRTEHKPGYFSDPGSWPVGEGLQRSLIDKDGREFPIEISLSSLPTASGTEVSMAIRDISERLAAQAEQERLRAEAERERFGRRLQHTRNGQRTAPGTTTGPTAAPSQAAQRSPVVASSSTQAAHHPEQPSRQETPHDLAAGLAQPPPAAKLASAPTAAGHA